MTVHVYPDEIVDGSCIDCGDELWPASCLCGPYVCCTCRARLNYDYERADDYRARGWLL